MPDVQFEVHTSAIWQTTSTIISSSAECLVVDPAYFPAEIDHLAARASSTAHISALVFTHGHWDHVVGSPVFPHVPTWMHPSLQTAAAGLAALDRARAFDSRWYITRPAGYSWPHNTHPLGDDQLVDIAGIRIRTFHIPGHSPDGVALLVEDAGLLIVGDHLSPCEIPFIDDLTSYRATLTRLIALLSGDNHIRHVVPGHGPMLSNQEALVIARDDATYLDRLLDARAHNDAALAAAVPLPRAANVTGMDEAHQKNCTKALQHS